MGTEKEVKIYFLIGVFMLTCVFAYRSTGTSTVVVKPPMKDYFSSIQGYTTLRQIPLESSAFEMLNLDDYIFADYLGPDGNVNLFIGYYYSAGKAYSAHSPLICYPSQGWEIDTQPVRHVLDVEPHAIHYEEIVTSVGETKEVVLYWYQAYQQTNVQVYENKIDMGFNKFVHNNEQHAFVRVSVPFTGATSRKAHLVAISFMQSFYPQFLQYIDDDVTADPLP